MDNATCPFCNSEQIVGFDIDVNAEQVEQTMICNDCDGEWVDVYTLSHRTDGDGMAIEGQEAQAPDQELIDALAKAMAVIEWMMPVVEGETGGLRSDINEQYRDAEEVADKHKAQVTK